MKSTIFISTFLLISSWSMSQCKFDDCIIDPVPKKCESYCDSKFSKLRKATFTELMEIGGFTDTIASKIFLNDTISYSLNKFYKSLNEIDKASFKNSFMKLNDNQLKYFELQKEDRKIIIELIEKKRLNLNEYDEIKKSIPNNEKRIIRDIEKKDISSDKNNIIIEELQR
jgi:hypothetical protein